MDSEEKAADKESPVERGRSSRPPFPETLRFLYLVFLPLAGCLAARWSGGSIGRGWGIGMAIALFLYHYLLWALYETERSPDRTEPATAVWSRWTWLVPPLLVLAILRADPVSWLVEQTLLESVAFLGAVAALAMGKCASEGRSAPWGLAIAVFVVPAAAIAVKLALYWWSRRETGPGWADLGFAAVFLFSAGLQFRRIRPFVMGGDQLVEPLSSPGRTVFMAVWFIGLLIGGIAIGG